MSIFTKNFFKRAVTTIILIPIVVALLFYLSLGQFAVASGIIIIGGCWEWTSLLGLTSLPSRTFFTLMLIGIIYSLGLVFPVFILAALFWWLLALVLVVAYPRLKVAWGRSYTLRFIMGVLTLGGCWYALNLIYAMPSGQWFLLVLLLYVWGADIFAYFGGKFFGRRKLCPSVSPGKTIEGLLVGIIGVLSIAYICFKTMPLPLHHSLWLWLGIAIDVALISVLGDLTISMLKRNVNLKDSGNLLPGHGGLLDRIDSLTAAAPVFWLGLKFWLEG